MLVLALEFSRGFTARALPTHNFWVFGHARGERPSPAHHRTGGHDGIAGIRPDGRSLKTEERGPTPSVGTEFGDGRAPWPLEGARLSEER